jgi:integrase
MAKIHFLLKEPQYNVADTDKQESLVLLVYRLKDKRIVKSVREKVNPVDWDFNEQLPKVKRNRADLAELRSKLSSYRMDIEAGLIKLRTNVFYEDFDDANKLIEQVTGGKKKQKALEVSDYMHKEFMKGMKPDNIKLHRYFLKTLYKCFKNITITEMNLDRYNTFKNFLLDSRVTQNTARNYLSAFKRVARYITENGNANNLQIELMKLPSFEKVYKLALSVEELETLYKHKYSDENIRMYVDFFLLLAFTGIRRKDAMSAGSVNFDGSDFFVIDTSKTRSRVIVPQHWIVKDIIKRYNGMVNVTRGVDVITQKWREAAKEAGIYGDLIYSITKGRKTERVVVPRYKAISFHTARRSFATNLHKAGIPVKVAMLFTGHKTVAQYMDYIKIDEQDNATEYMTHDFFNKTSNK